MDKEASSVRLIHFTLRDYLSAHPDIFSRPRSAMAEICLTYLNSRQIKALLAAPWPGVQNIPFIEYCSIYWGVHAKKELSDCARSLALELLKRNYNPISTKLLLRHAKHFTFRSFRDCSGFSRLHCASFFRIVEVVSALIEEGCYNINEQDFCSCIPPS